MEPKWKSKSKSKFVESSDKNCLYFLMKLVYNESFVLVSVSAHSISRKIPVPNLWTKMLSANEIAVFLNQQYVRNELTDYPNDLKASTVKNSSQQLETIISVFCDQSFDKRFSFR